MVHQERVRSIIAGTVSILLVVSMCACSKGGQTNLQLEKGEIVEWYYPGSTQSDMALVEKEINNITVPTAGAGIKFMPIDPGAYDEKMNLMMASGTAFDICFSGYVNTYSRGVSLNGFLRLNDYIDARPALKAALPQYAWNVVDVGGGDIYAVPNLQLYAIPQMVSALREYTEKYGVDVTKMTNVNEIEPYLETIKYNEPTVYPYTPSKGVYPWAKLNTEELLIGIESLVINRDDKTAKIFKLYDTPGYIEGVTTLHKWFEKGYIRSDIASAQNQGQNSKKNAVSIEAYKPGVQKDYANAHNGDEIEYFVLEEPYLATYLATQTLNAVGVNSRHPNQALDFLQQVYTNTDVYRLIVHGIKGTHYEMVDDIHFSPINKERYNMHNNGWMFGNQFNALLAEGKAADTWEKTMAVNETAQRSPILGLMLSTANVMNEVANVTAIEEEYSGLLNGSVGPEKIPEMKQRLETAGIDRIIADLQKQIDGFLREKSK